MRPRPMDFYGPEDSDGIEPWQETDARIKSRQAEWDADYAALPWWRKLLSILGTSA